VDTCCINKLSSAELSEAINSMYRWYEDATTCYGYLLDVSYAEGSFSHDPKTVSFPESKWFTQGWILQELIAPSKVIFYSRERKYLEAKSELARELTDITGIV
jgi:hypothetical protein